MESQLSKSLISNVELMIGNELIQRTWRCEKCQVWHTDDFPTSDAERDKKVFCEWYCVWKELASVSG